MQNELGVAHVAAELRAGDGSGSGIADAWKM